jgi:hypothetical protein
MVTLDKIDEIEHLQHDINKLKTEIRTEQRDCKHEFNSDNFEHDNLLIHASCLHCGYISIRKHGIIEIENLSKKERRLILNQIFNELYRENISKIM